MIKTSLDIRSRVNDELVRSYGAFETYLEKVYQNKIIEKLSGDNKKEQIAWSTYNQVIIEFKNNLNNDLLVKELLYKLTEKQLDSSKTCVEIIKRIAIPSKELERLYNKIINF